MRWSVPRELLWAIIGSLAIVVLALLPSHYPYGQAPKVQPQHQAENSISSDGAADHRPAAQVNPSSEQKGEYGGQHAEFAILGVKPGEWLLSFATFMLWVATVRLVKGADQTAERQLRAYLSIAHGSFDVTPAENGTINLRANFKIRNDGKTPARFVKTDTAVEFHDLPLSSDLPVPAPNRITYSRVVNPDQEIDGSTVRNFRPGVVPEGRALYVFIRVTYIDAFDVERESLSCGYMLESAKFFGGSMTGPDIRITFTYADRHNTST